jgi:hypothetical protein
LPDGVGHRSATHEFRFGGKQLRLIYQFDLSSIAALPVYPDRSPNGDRRVPVESVYASNVSQFLYPAPLPFTLMRVLQALVPRSAFLNAKEIFL